MVTGSIGEDLLVFTTFLFEEGAVARAGCVLFETVLEGAADNGKQTAGSSLEDEALEDDALEDDALEDEALDVDVLVLDDCEVVLVVCDEGDDDDGVTPHAERTMANKVRKKLDFTRECI
jgi:hypothetical protein